MDRPAFIYALADDSGVRYVGRSVDPDRRKAEHGSGWSDSRSRLFDARSSRLIVLEAATVADWKDRERFWVAALSARCPLVNVQGNPRIKYVRRSQYGSWDFVMRDALPHGPPAEPARE